MATLKQYKPRLYTLLIMFIILSTQLDSLKNQNGTWLNDWLTPGVIVGILVLLLMLYFNWRKNTRNRPTMSKIEGIFDEFGNRLLFTIISNNPAGSRVGELFISKRFLRLFFINKTRIYYTVNDEFLEPQRGAIIPKYLIQGQETFVTAPNGDHVIEVGTYKLTFYTSDGRCSNNYRHLLSSLLQLSLQKYKQ